MADSVLYSGRGVGGTAEVAGGLAPLLVEVEDPDRAKLASSARDGATVSRDPIDHLGNDVAVRAGGHISMVGPQLVEQGEYLVDIRTFPQFLPVVDGGPECRRQRFDRLHTAGGGA